MAQMMSSKRSRSSLLEQPRSELLALLLVSTLLICHGVFGALHLCSAPPVLPVHQDHQHPLSAETGAVHHEQPGCHPVHAAEYFAVLLAGFLALILGQVLKEASSWGRLSVP